MSITEIIELISLIITGLGLIGSILGWVSEVKNKNFKELIEKKMTEAEELGLTNAEKKAWVISQVAEELKIKDTFDKVKISNYIEECIDFKNKLTNKNK